MSLELKNNLMDQTLCREPEFVRYFYHHSRVDQALLVGVLIFLDLN